MAGQQGTSTIQTSYPSQIHRASVCSITSQVAEQKALQSCPFTAQTSRESGVRRKEQAKAFQVVLVQTSPRHSEAFGVIEKSLFIGIRRGISSKQYRSMHSPQGPPAVSRSVQVSWSIKPPNANLVRHRFTTLRQSFRHFSFASSI